MVVILRASSYEERLEFEFAGGSNQLTYAYDNANRLTSVTGWNSNSTTCSYDDAGRMTATTLPSGTGIVSAYTYDNADRLTNIAHVKGGSTTIASVDYTLDDVGNRTQRVDQQGTHTYVYDDLHRLTSVTYPGPSTTTYDFDAFGNRAEMTTGAGTTTYAYDDADRLTEVDPPAASPVAYTWDDNGNLTDRGSDAFGWDYEDRMVQATVNSVTTNFVYRGDGLRDSRAVSGGATTTFTWDIASGLPVVLDDGNQYVYGAGLTSMKQGGNWYYYLADGLGSTMAVVDSSGVSQKSYQYDVYGEATPSGGLANEFDFAGQQTDGTGLQYLRARYYDPETGTFLSRDPMATAPDWTDRPYGYGSASPTNETDPTGLCNRRFHPCISKCLLIDCPDPGDEIFEAGIKFLEALQSLNDLLVGGELWRLLGEKADDVADAVVNAVAEKPKDPLFWMSALQYSLGLVARQACVKMTQAWQACLAAIGAMALVTTAKYQLIRSRYASGEMSNGELACRVMVDIVNAVLPATSKDPGPHTRFGGGQVCGTMY